MKEKKTRPAKTNEFGRREFGQRAAMALTGAALAGTPLAGLSRDFVADPLSTALEQEQEQEANGLSQQARAEVESKFQHVIATYGSRLNDDQKKLMRRTITEHVRMLEAVRSTAVANGNAPATVLKLVEHKTPQSANPGE